LHGRVRKYDDLAAINLVGPNGLSGFAWLVLSLATAAGDRAGGSGCWICEGAEATQGDGNKKIRI